MKKITIGLNGEGFRLGENHGRAKLSDEDVDKIRELHEAGGTGYRLLARQFNVSRSTIRDIIKYRRRGGYPVNWKTIEVPDEADLVAL